MSNPADFYWTVLNAMPMPVFVLDGELRICDLNSAAQAFFEVKRELVLKERPGDVLHCLHATRGCGRGAHCADCVVRNSVNASFARQKVSRRRVKFETNRSGIHRDFELLVTASAFPFESETLTLLVLEDITELMMLKNLLPICMHCKKIRDDNQYWERLETYFQRFIGVEFSHGICPDCVTKFYGAKFDPSASK
jgi:nitrogen-specific signal transduction histidine kinase